MHGLPGDDSDEQARYLEATINGVRVASIYLPNGNPVPGPKFDYKLAWMARLYERSQALLADEMPIVLGGDFNVIEPLLAEFHCAAHLVDDLLLAHLELVFPVDRAGCDENVQALVFCRIE